jgi:hypothetical protein
VHPEADVSVTSRASRSFQGIYGGVLGAELHDVLEYFNGACSLGAVVERMPAPLSEYLLDVVTWLLRFIVRCIDRFFSVCFVLN